MSEDESIRWIHAGLFLSHILVDTDQNVNISGSYGGKKSHEGENEDLTQEIETSQ